MPYQSLQTATDLPAPAARAQDPVKRPYARHAIWSATAVWALTRLWLVSAALEIGPFHQPGGLDRSVDEFYPRWFAVLSGGAFPAHDVTWQYPPGAAAPILAPGLVPFLDYGHAFVVLCALCDAAVLAGLLYAATRRGSSMAGPWLWIAGLALLGTVPWRRFDVMVTAVAMAALIAAASRKAWADRVFGALTAVGAMIKVWPVLLLAGTGRGGRTRTAVTYAAVAAAVSAACLALTMPHAFSFLSGQKERGIQIESVGSLPFHVARHFGWSGGWAERYGSHEFVGPGVQWVVWGSQALSVLALGWLLWWRTRSDRAAVRVLPDAALTAVLLFVVTSRVISPQYMVWLVGLAAVCLLRPATTQRPVAWLLLAACVFTVAEFPFLYAQLRADADPLAIAVLYARNLLLLAAAGLSAWRLWRATAGARRAEHRACGGLAP
ncbi:glycosyltransferase 87 family protein [Streptomyces sp. 8N616]|uniref:glycosyltransferase 87 family protein n=1 Tax=Streptomyces sp. 8N616 TaxID=3457414 RepID=UPI003FD33619